MMRFKSGNMDLQHMNHYLKKKEEEDYEVSEEENNAYILDKYFYYQVYLRGHNWMLLAHRP